MSKIEDREAQLDRFMMLTELHESITELTAALRGQTLNKVLSTELIIIPAAGFWTRDFSVPFGSWAVANLGDGAMVVSNAPPGIAAPGAGVGAQKVPSGAAPVVNMAGSTLTVYGTVGDQANLQVFVRPQPPSYSGSGPQPAAATGTPSNVAGSAASVTVLAANPNRKGAVVYNDSTAVLYLLLSAAGPASLTNYTVQLPAQSYFELPPPVYTGIVLGIWAAANGFARVTEFT